MEVGSDDDSAAPTAAAAPGSSSSQQRRSIRSRAPPRSMYDDALLQALSESGQKKKETTAGDEEVATTAAAARGSASAKKRGSRGNSSRRRGGKNNKEEESDDDDDEPDEEEENSSDDGGRGTVHAKPSSGGRGNRGPRQGAKQTKKEDESSDVEMGDPDDDNNNDDEEEEEESSSSEDSDDDDDDDESSYDEAAKKASSASKKDRRGGTAGGSAAKKKPAAAVSAAATKKKKKKKKKSMVDSDDSDGEDEDDDDAEPSGRAGAVRFAKDTAFGTGAAAANKKKKTAKKAPAAAAPRRAAALGAGTIAAFAKRALHKDETPETSLVAALWKVAVDVHGSSKGKPSSVALLPGSHKERLRTAMLQDLARRVVNEHAADPNQAEVRLLNLLFRSVGGTYEYLIQPNEVDLGDLENDEWEKLFVDLCVDMESTPVELVMLSADPLGAVHAANVAASATSGSTKAASRKNPTQPMTVLYRDLFASFWHAVGTVAVADNNGPGHRFPMEAAKGILNRMIEATAVFQPDIRLAAILAAYQMGAAFLERVQELEDKVDSAERQLKVAKRTQSEVKAGALSNQISRWTRSMAELQDLIDNGIINSIFLDRYKDINPHIRALSLETMSKFSMISPSTFLKGTYLKYAGWMLRDRDPTVRATAIVSWMAPLKAPKGEIDTAPMQVVFDKFLEDIVSRSRDVDTTVQDKAMDLLLLLLRQGFLDSKSPDDTIWNQVNLKALDANSTPHVRKQGLYFVVEQLDGFADAGKDGYATESETVAQLDDLTKWVAHTLCDGDLTIERIRYEYVDLIVHSLRGMEEHKHLATSWNAMLRILESDDKFVNEAQNRVLAVKHRVALKMFLCSASIEGQLCSDSNPIAEFIDPYLVAARRSAVEALDVAATSRSNGKKKPKAAGDSSMETLNGVLLEKLPSLLSTFKGDASILRSLTILPQYLDPRHFSHSNRKTALLQLLRRICDIFLASADEQVIANCSVALCAMADLKHTRTDDVILLRKETALKVRDRTLGLLKEKAKMDARSASPDDGSLENLQLSLCLCLRRLGALASRFDLIVALSNSKSSGLGKLCDVIGEDLTVDLKARKVGDDGNLPSIWTGGDPGLHQVVAVSIEEGLRFLLKVVAFRLKSVVDEGKLQDEVDLDSHEVLVMRHRLLKLLSLCFDLQGDVSVQGDDNDLEYTPEFTKFSYGLQCVAMSVFSDMRMLFPAVSADSTSPLLRACAMNFSENGSLPQLLLGGSLRFLSRNGEQLRGGASQKAVKDLLVAPARGCLASWTVGNRSEGAFLLSHLSGSGPQAHDIVLQTIRALKKMDPKRLLESHFLSLTILYNTWLEDRPFLESDSPSDEEMEQYHEEDQQHREKRDQLEAMATKLSSTLGVGRLSNPAHGALLELFLVKCINFALNLQDLSEEYPGERLGFLSLAAKYCAFARKLPNERLKNIRDTFHQQEAEFRSAVDFLHVADSDRRALADFRKALGLVEWTEHSPQASRRRPPSDSPSLADDDDDLDFPPGNMASAKSDRSRMSLVTERSEREDYDVVMGGSKSQRSVASSGNHSFPTVDGAAEEGDDDDDDDDDDVDDDDDDSFSRAMKAKMRTQSSQSVGTRSSAGRVRRAKGPPPMRYKAAATGDGDDSTLVSRGDAASRATASEGGGYGSSSVASKKSPARSSRLSKITALLLSQDLDESDQDDRSFGNGGAGDDDDEDESHDESAMAASAGIAAMQVSSPAASKGSKKRSRRRDDDP